MFRNRCPLIIHLVPFRLASPLDFCQTKCYDTYARQNRR
nr:MAG TPA: hypothetical protein [Caudoviricetes sp.]